MSDPIEYCECCRMIDLLEWCNSKSDDKEFYHKFSVAFVNTIHKRNRKTVLGSSTHYRNKGMGFDLNFCPTCGKKLKKDD